MSKPRPTLPLARLVPGRRYRDTLSGRTVLVLLVGSNMGYAIGRFWNPVTGRHENTDLHDHQLQLLKHR